MLVATVLCENTKSISHDSLSSLLPRTVNAGGESERRLYEVPALSLSTVSATKEK